MKFRMMLPAAALLAAGVLVKRLPGERRQEISAIDDQSTADAYAQLTGMPQFGLIHQLIAKKALAGGFVGHALDVGGGPGRLAIQMARLSAPQATFVSLDASPAMVDIAEKRARAAGLAGRVVSSQGVAENMPFPDDHFDLVVSSLSLHHWDEPTIAFREIDRVLKPGGRLLIVDARRDTALLPWAFVNTVERVLPLVNNVGQFVPYGMLHCSCLAGEPTGSFKSSYTPDEVLALLAVAGLTKWKVTSGPAWLFIEK